MPLPEGQKIYWICPLVEESEEIKLMSAEDRFAMLQPVFGNVVGLIHGRMSGRDKDEAMRAFKAGETRILVGTTVIEVGVDVPDATIMVIEHAERFGLAQLHQLRGRVGRGEKPSTCVLLYKAPLGETAMRRLQVMRETEDGFRISEEDLKLRGEGEVLGTRQSGTPGFQVARIEAHADLLEVARDDADYCCRVTRNCRASAALRSGCCSICSAATRRCGCCAPAEQCNRLDGAAAARLWRPECRSQRRCWLRPTCSAFAAVPQAPRIPA